jgi:AraC-like DNA-binding protein
MGIGGQLNTQQARIEARLLLAYTGVTRFDSTGWSHLRPPSWVLDYIHHGRQRQRVRREKEFVRLSSVAALYAPGADYHEWRESSGSLDESYIVFQATGGVERVLRGLTGRGGWCHFRDPEHVIGDRLRRLGELLFYRQPGYELLAHGSFVELIGLLTVSQPAGPRLRIQRQLLPAGERDDLPGRVERYVRANIAASLRVADLARHVGMSPSAFAHAYPSLAGESPHRTILRLKIEAGKRLILQEGLSVKETSARLGFSSEFHFSRLFKRLEGVAPQHYRQALKKQAVGRSADQAVRRLRL